MPSSQNGAPSGASRSNASRLPRFWLALALILILLLIATPPVYRHLRAAGVLMVIADMHDSPLMHIGANPVSEEVITFHSTMDEPARIYHPVGVTHPSPVVVVHGVHHLGMEEPRLKRFARALASHGYLVMTPQVDPLADYNVEKGSAVIIGDAVHELARRSGSPKVGLLGLSFAGGMSLIAASDPAVAGQLSAVVAVGAHDNLERVLRYYETDHTAGPNGEPFTPKAHEYGSLVTAYSHVPLYFSAADVPQARVVLRTLLWEHVDQAKEEAKKLSPAGQARMAELFAHDTKSLVADTDKALAQVRPELIAASPSTYAARIHVPVYLLHGAEDNVVPPTETLWLEHDLPKGVVKEALVTKAIGHVEVDGSSWKEQWKLIHWMEQMLAALSKATAARG